MVIRRSERRGRLLEIQPNSGGRPVCPLFPPRRARGNNKFEEESKPAPLKPKGAAPKVKTNCSGFATRQDRLQSWPIRFGMRDRREVSVFCARNIYDYDTQKSSQHRQSIRKRPICPRFPAKIGLKYLVF